MKIPLAFFKNVLYNRFRSAGERTGGRAGGRAGGHFLRLLKSVIGRRRFRNGGFRHYIKGTSKKTLAIQLLKLTLCENKEGKNDEDY